MVDVLRHEDFAPHVGKMFSFPGQTVTLRLDRVELGRHTGPADASRTPFIAVFCGPVGAILPEGFYRAETEDGPALEFYIMPIHTPARDRQEYQAVFN